MHVLGAVLEWVVEGHELADGGQLHLAAIVEVLQLSAVVANECRDTIGAGPGACQLRGLGSGRLSGLQNQVTDAEAALIIGSAVGK